jgi:hypothetical protein
MLLLNISALLDFGKNCRRFSNELKRGTEKAKIILRDYATR